MSRQKDSFSRHKRRSYKNYSVFVTRRREHEYETSIKFLARNIRCTILWVVRIHGLCNTHYAQPREEIHHSRKRCKFTACFISRINSSHKIKRIVGSVLQFYKRFNESASTASAAFQGLKNSCLYEEIAARLRTMESKVINNDGYRNDMISCSWFSLSSWFQWTINCFSAKIHVIQSSKFVL